MFFTKNSFKQGRREGVKGVTVSRGPDPIKGPEITKTKEKVGKYKKFLHFGH
jgi:hypothetical protein